MHSYHQHSERQPRSGAHFDLVYRAPKPHDANAHAPFHSADERILKEGREPRLRSRASYDVLQLRQDTYEAAHVPCDGRWRFGAALGSFGYRCALGSDRAKAWEEGLLSEARSVKGPCRGRCFLRDLIDGNSVPCKGSLVPFGFKSEADPPMVSAEARPMSTKTKPQQNVPPRVDVDFFGWAYQGGCPLPASLCTDIPKVMSATYTGHHVSQEIAVTPLEDIIRPALTVGSTAAKSILTARGIRDFLSGVALSLNPLPLTRSKLLHV